MDPFLTAESISRQLQLGEPILNSLSFKMSLVRVLKSTKSLVCGYFVNQVFT